MNRPLTRTLFLLALPVAVTACTISGPDIHIRPPIQIEVEGDGYHHHKHHHHHDD